MLRALLAVGILGSGLVTAVALATDDPPTGERTDWKGRPAREITAILGEPTKTKKRPDGGKALIYRVVRVAPGAAPAAGFLVVDFPGVGLVARPAPAPAPDDTTWSTEPTELDERGQLTPGGMERTRSRSVSRDLETGEVRDSGPGGGAERPAGRGNVKLTFLLDADGRVVDWSQR